MNQWKIKQHTYQIADTGDYDGCVEITNGKISLFCDCDVENEELNPIIDALNNSEIEFEIDDSPSIELLHENARLKEDLKRFNGAVEIGSQPNSTQLYRQDTLTAINPDKFNLYAIPKPKEE